MTPSRGRVLRSSLIVLWLVVVGCGRDTEPRRAPAGAIRIGSFDFTESAVLAELYAQALEREGVDVVRRTRLGPRESVEPALEQGHIDLVPEYAATALTFFDRGGRRATADADATHALLREAAAARGLTALAAAPARNENAFAVTAATAARLRLTRVSELAPFASTLRFGGPPECQQRQFCLPGLREVYGLTFKSVAPLDAGGPLTFAALEGGEVDVALLFTTTPQPANTPFVLLADDRGLQPADNVVPVIRTAVLERFQGRVAPILDSLSAEVTSDDLRSLNKAVDIDGRTPEDVVREWLLRHPRGS